MVPTRSSRVRFSHASNRRRLLAAATVTEADGTLAQSRFEPSPVEARRLISAAPFVWHQRFQLAPGVYAPGQNDIEWLLDMAGLPTVLNGKTVIDIGTTNGGAAFDLERRGAERIVATDIVDENWFGFAALSDFFRSRVQFRRTSIYETGFVIRERFDIVLMFGVLYHLRHPLIALDNLRHLIGGAAYVETAVADYERPELAAVSAARFYRKGELSGDPSNWFAPTVTGLLDWCHSAGLSPEIVSAWPKDSPQRCMIRVTRTTDEPEFTRLSYERPLFTTVNWPPATLPTTPPAGGSTADDLQPPQVPWTAEYAAAHRQFVSSMLKSPKIVELFAAQEQLPSKYGVGLDQRVVEYLWLCAQPLRGCAIDAGSALNHDHVLDHVLPRLGALHIFTKAPEDVQFQARGISYVFGDLRDLPYRDGFFDTLICVSTLEHVGMDNRRYGVDEEMAADPDMQVRSALLEMRRVVAPGGQMLITVPFGKSEDHGWFRQFGRRDIENITQVFPAAKATIDVFKYTSDGWQRSDLASASSAHYRDFTLDPSPVDDLAAAARAVACLRLTF